LIREEDARTSISFAKDVLSWGEPCHRQDGLSAQQPCMFQMPDALKRPPDTAWQTPPNSYFLDTMITKKINRTTTNTPMGIHIPSPSPPAQLLI
jgi:hypothetical protein